MIRFENCQFQIAKFSLALNLSVQPGQFVSVLGGSGAGKSTLLSLVAGFETPSQGKLFLDGAELENAPPAKRPVSMVFQDHNAFAHLDVWTNVALGISPALKLNKQQLADIDAALERVGLADYAKRRPGEISGGERQRVALARVLVRNRKILLLDEPFAALDPGLRRNMLDLVLALQAEHGLTVLMVTHMPEEARYAGGQILFVAEGVARATVRAVDFFNSRGDQAIAKYLGDWR